MLRPAHVVVTLAVAVSLATPAAAVAAPSEQAAPADNTTTGTTYGAATGPVHPSYASDFTRRLGLARRTTTAPSTPALVLPSPAKPSPLAPTPTSASALAVAPWGSDSAEGTLQRPFRTVSRALSAVRPGQTLYLRGGTFTERVINPPLTRGTADLRVTVTAYPGETPVLSGLLWLTNASYWTVSGVTVQWAPGNDRSEQMVKMISGTGWVLENSTIRGARSYAGLLVCGTATDWSVRGNTVRDTYASNGVNQDHLLYVNTTGTNGVIERNTLVNSPNGQAVKVGPPNAATGSVTGRLTIRYNTMRDNLGPANVQLSHLTSNVSIYRNLFVRAGSNRSAVAAWDLSGSGNMVFDNAYWDAVRPVDTQWSGLRDTGGNVRLDPAAAAGSYGVTGRTG